METDREPERGRQPAAVALALCLLWVSGASSTETPKDPEEAAAQLSQTREKIKAISRRISADRSQRDALSAALRETEKRIAALAGEVDGLDERLGVKRSHLRTLKKNREARRNAIAAQREELARHVRAAYRLGRQDRLKLLLSQEDAASVSRAFTYYEYFNRARARRINLLREEMHELEQIESGIRDQTAALERLQTQKAKAKAEIEQQHARRRDVISKLEARIRQAGNQMERLREDEKRLTELVEKLEKELAALVVPTDEELTPFAELRGKLAWPVAGKIRHGFGTLREEGDLKWQGVVIAGKRGDPVHAISNGRVAFAEWLRGFGFLVILDHGDGYMSLYGHNDSLQREAGDWVERGEVIATVGDSGGQPETALYFEIRHNGAPSNPAKWCTRPGSAALVVP